jgi:hypothetical protein
MMIELIDNINKMMKDDISNIHTNLIVEIVAVNGGLVNVKPVSKMKAHGEYVDAPIFTEVIPINISGGGSTLQMPISVGDYGLYIVSERCADAWKMGLIGGVPPSDRLHDLSDGFVIVGIYDSNGLLIIPDIATMTGDFKIIGDAEITGDLIVGGDLKVVGDIESGGDLKVGGGIESGGDLIVGGAGQIAGNLIVGGAIVATGVVSGANI